MMSCRNFMTAKWVVVILLIFAAAPFVCGLTDPYDVYAIIRFYASLGFPQLPGWNSIGGDPCGLPNWQGVQCENANIIGINLSDASLSGVLTDLNLFNSIILLDLSNNQIGGSVPSKLPTTLRNLLLSDNQLSGSIPETLSSLAQLTNLSLNDNHLTGPIPDAFHELRGLVNLDLSGNSLTDDLPYSMGSLSSLTTLHMQNNKLSGTLDVIQDLPLRDLNVENNKFSGLIPDRLRNIPNFRVSGNLFNITIIPPPLPPSEAPSPQLAPKADPNGPSEPQISGKKKNNKTANLIWIGIIVLFVILGLVVGLCLYMSRCCRSDKMTKKHETGTNGVLIETRKPDQSLQKSLNQVKKVSKEVPPPLPLLPSERIVADPIITVLPPTAIASEIADTAKFFTIASLQEYTNSFSQGNLIGKGTLGTVYRAQLPSGKLLAVKKLDKTASRHMNDQQFLEMVSNVSKIHHENIVELVGYCIEHGQRLLIYNYCRNGTLHEALEYDEEINKRVSWNSRMRLALQTAKALEYLHEVCEPPIVHRNFKSANVLLDDDLAVQVSDCGLAPLLSSGSMTQLQGCGYGAPELELGSYTYQSEVYSFGVVMLELLTGLKSYDRLRPRGEQYLARWAFSQLHDIDALSRMVDPSLIGAYPSKSLSRLADIISLCIQPEPEFRPPMSEIVQKLVHMRQREL